MHPSNGKISVDGTDINEAIKSWQSLIAYVPQDIYLTGNPQITFFKVVYKRHTNFASEAIEQTFSGNIGFGQKMSCKITKNGDLITKIYLKIKPNREYSPNPLL